ncbi:MAG: hypothetical protein WB769_07350 [Pseudolabrys sp.]
MSRALTMLMPRRKVAIWLLVGFGLLVLVVANGHLVDVAMTSQPDCVAHVRQGEGNGMHDQFSAARSSCTPG